MQCHLGLCLSLRCDFTLEPFTRGLASEDADQHAQRFVAVIARRTLPCYASKPLIALLSRTDHNAATPSASLMLCFALSVVGDRTCGHHVIAGRAAEPQARSSPPARKGRSEAEWLDRAEDRRTIRRRDGRTRAATRSLSARTYETNETRRLEDRQEVTAGDRLRR